MSGWVHSPTHPGSFCMSAKKISLLRDVFKCLVDFSCESSLYIPEFGINGLGVAELWKSSQLSLAAASKLADQPHLSEPGKGPWYWNSARQPVTSSRKSILDSTMPADQTEGFSVEKEWKTEVLSSSLENSSQNEILIPFNRLIAKVRARKRM